MDEIQRDKDLGYVEDGIISLARLLDIDEKQIVDSLIDGLMTNSVDLEENPERMEIIDELKTSFNN